MIYLEPTKDHEKASQCQVVHASNITSNRHKCILAVHGFEQDDSDSQEWRKTWSNDYYLSTCETSMHAFLKVVSHDTDVFLTRVCLKSLAFAYAFHFCFVCNDPLHTVLESMTHCCCRKTNSESSPTSQEHKIDRAHFRVRKQKHHAIANQMRLNLQLLCDRAATHIQQSRHHKKQSVTGHHHKRSGKLMRIETHGLLDDDL